MARRHSVVTITDGNEPDSPELKFFIHQMSATQAMRFSIRAIIVLAAIGVDIPQGANLRQAIQLMQRQEPGKLLSGLTQMEPEKVYPVLDELLCGVHLVSDPDAADAAKAAKTQVTPQTVDSVVCEMSTLLALYQAVIELNFGFTLAGLSQKASEPSPSPA